MLLYVFFLLLFRFLLAQQTDDARDTHNHNNNDHHVQWMSTEDFYRIKEMEYSLISFESKECPYSQVCSVFISLGTRKTNRPVFFFSFLNLVSHSLSKRSYCSSIGLAKKRNVFLFHCFFHLYFILFFLIWFPISTSGDGTRAFVNRSNIWRYRYLFRKDHSIIITVYIC